MPTKDVCGLRRANSGLTADGQEAAGGFTAERESSCEPFGSSRSLLDEDSSSGKLPCDMDELNLYKTSGMHGAQAADMLCVNSQQVGNSLDSRLDQELHSFVLAQRTPNT